MLSDWVRQRTRGLADPVTRWLCRTRVTPDFLTVLGFVFGVGVGFLLAFGQLRWGGVLLIAASLCDYFDGALARRLARTTKFGAFLDSVLDRFSEAAIFAGFILYFHVRGDGIYLILSYVAFVGSLLVSYARARAEGLDIECKVGFGTRFERMVILIVGLILAQPKATVAILAVLTSVTSLQRVYHVWRIARQGKE